MTDDFDLLIVDDEPGILALLTEVFVERGLNVATATCVKEARAEFSRRPFKVVLSDHNLPDGNGVDFLAEIGGLGTSAVPILMTGATDLRVAVEAINRGKVFKFVTKPLDIEALALTVRRALDHYAAQHESERVTRDVLRHNERLARDLEAREERLRAAAQRIRKEEMTVERQKAQIESLYAEIQQAYLRTVTSLTAAIEAKDRYTKGHSLRVFHYCSLMANELGLPESSRSDLRLASLLHDLGKIGISDAILHKPGKLTEDEFRVMATHPTITDDILRPLPFLATVRRIIREHHERFDGKGYPSGLKGAECSLEGRILAVADAYDAMRSDRSYRRALSRDAAITELKAGSGTQFCPLCVGAMIVALESRGEGNDSRPDSAAVREWEEEYLRLQRADKAVPVCTVNN